MENLTEIEKNSVENLRKYLRIPTAHPNPNYEPCVELFKNLANEIGLIFDVVRGKSNKPNLILTWSGIDPSLSSVMLNSHMDVVPASEIDWSYKPFNADVDEQGNIYARGTQDVKSLGIQYLEAIKRLKLKGIRPKRSVHVTFVCDEEIGGLLGMQELLKSEQFQRLKVGFALDEAGVSEDNTITIHYAERRAWNLEVNCSGTSGHGSLLLDNTAAEKVQSFLDNVYKFRYLQKIKGREGTTINLTMISGGTQCNTIPSKISLKFDIRILNENVDHFKKLVHEWCNEAGNDVSIEDNIQPESPPTIIDDSNLFWVALKAVTGKQNIKLIPEIPFPNTDGRHLRSAGIPTIGFTPNLHTSKRIHANDEYLNVKVFLNGIKLLEDVIVALSNV